MLGRYAELRAGKLSREQFCADLTVCCSAELLTLAGAAASVSTGLSYLAPLGGVCGSVLGASAVLAATWAWVSRATRCWTWR